MSRSGSSLHPPLLVLPPRAFAWGKTDLPRSQRVDGNKPYGGHGRSQYRQAGEHQALERRTRSGAARRPLLAPGVRYSYRNAVSKSLLVYACHMYIDLSFSKPMAFVSPAANV